MRSAVADGNRALMNLTETQAKLFTDPNYGWATTIREDGTPHSTVVWLDYDGEHVLFNTAKPRAKWKHLMRDPRVTVSVVDPENAFNYVSVTGSAEVTEDGANDHIDKLAQKYTGAERYGGHRPDETRVIVRVTPERVAGT
jgi:PPOX class probable F420-dependent enzyme